MSIKLLALELYRAQQQVAQLEKQLAAAGNASEVLREKLRVARAELQQLRNMLEGHKAAAAPTIHIPGSRRTI